MRRGHKILDKNGQPKQLAVTTFENADKAHMNGLELVASYDFGSLVAYRYSLRAMSMLPLCSIVAICLREVQLGHSWSPSVSRMVTFGTRV